MRPLRNPIPARCRRVCRRSLWTVACVACIPLLAAPSGADDSARTVLRAGQSIPGQQPEPWRESARPLAPLAQDGSAGSFRVREPAELLSVTDRTFYSDSSSSGVQLASWETPAESADATSNDGEVSADTEPLSRLEWPEPDGSVDAGATLRGLAEGAGLVLAVCVVGLWGLRHWLVKRSQPAGSGHNLRRIESLALPQRCQVHLLDVQGKRVLVAMDAGGLKGVTVLPDSFDSLVELQGDGDAVDPPARRTAAVAATTFA